MDEELELCINICPFNHCSIVPEFLFLCAFLLPLPSFAVTKETIFVTLKGLLNCTSYKLLYLYKNSQELRCLFWSNFAVVSGVDFEVLPSTQFYSNETKGNASPIFSCVGQKQH